MKIRYILIIILIVVVVGTGIGLKMFFKPHADVNRLKPDFKVEATGLINEFQKDENAATAKYSEKILEISGKLATKNQLPNGTTLLILEDEMQGVSCQLDSNWVTANQAIVQSLEPGKPIKVKGVCKGYLMEIKVSPAVVVK
ncbi:MAG TPA: hypothetical protein VGK10_20640 [Prolixibacteraceae bacterium]|jgi:hypothetical protein